MVKIKSLDQIFPLQVFIFQHLTNKHVPLNEMKTVHTTLIKSHCCCHQQITNESFIKVHEFW